MIFEEEGREFEEHYNKLDISLVSKEENKKFKSDSHFQSRMRQKDKLLMNSAKNACSSKYKLHIWKQVQITISVMSV